MKIEEKDVVSVVKTGVAGSWWVTVSPSGDVQINRYGIWEGPRDIQVCYKYWLQVIGVKLTVRKPVRVRLSAEIVPTPGEA